MISSAIWCLHTVLLKCKNECKDFNINLYVNNNSLFYLILMVVQASTSKGGAFISLKNRMNPLNFYSGVDTQVKKRLS